MSNLQFHFVRSQNRLFVNFLALQRRKNMDSIVTANFPMSCLLKDDSFGPAISSNCRSFDFTLLFEQSVLSLLPSAIFLLVVPFRLWYLLRTNVKLLHSRLYLLKLVCSPTSLLHTSYLHLYVGDHLHLFQHSTHTTCSLGFTFYSEKPGLDCLLLFSLTRRCFHRSLIPFRIHEVDSAISCVEHILALLPHI